MYVIYISIKLGKSFAVPNWIEAGFTLLFSALRLLLSVDAMIDTGTDSKLSVKVNS